LLVTAPACTIWPTSGTGTSESLGESSNLVPGWAEKQGFAGNADAVAGAKIFAQVGCLNCHTYLGAGASNVGAPDLSAIGKASGRNGEDFARYVADPARFGNKVMPKFTELGAENLRKLGVFLEASKGLRKRR